MAWRSAWRSSGNQGSHRPRKPAAARRVVKAIKDGVDLLKDHPGIGRPGRLAGTRELVIRHYPFIVAYRQAESALQILAVVHTSRRWPDQLP